MPKSEEWEVKEIVSCRLNATETDMEFQVKWGGYDSDGYPWENTWEPAANLEHAPRAMQDFWKLQMEMMFPGRSARITLETGGVINVRMSPPPQEEVDKLLQRMDQSVKDFVDKANVLYATDGSSRNRVTNCVTKVQAVGAPDGFEFITANVVFPGLILPKLNPQSCSCIATTASKACTGCLGHGDTQGTTQPYDENGLLQLGPGQPVFECNIGCQCGTQCAMRSSQKQGLALPMMVFHFGPDKGWGLKAGVSMRKGAFVMEYMGEIIPNAEAERRYSHYTPSERTHLFDLDASDADQTFAIDSLRHANMARLINHSCEPNLRAHFVYSNNVHSAVPRVVLFAHTEVLLGAELTLDYMNPGQLSDTVMPVMKREPDWEQRMIQCLCGSQTCRGYIRP